MTISGAMQKRLTKHPDCISPVTNLLADAVRFADGRVKFVFMATGDVDRIVVPHPGEPVRKDELWRHTCFEAFLASDGDAYIELNFSPSGAWAAYRFDCFRSGMAKAEIDSPTIEAKRLDPMISLMADVDLGPLPELGPWQDWDVGLSAILEADDGSRSYWALAHPPGKPDFHHRDCFAAKLASDATL
jgi:hypothetical protein